MTGESKTAEIKKLYENYPYPTPTAGEMLISDISNLVQCIASSNYFVGRHILDAGCGTGHRLISIAKALPDTQFTGIDICEHSIATAKDLARRHGVSNVDFHIHDLNDPLSDSYSNIFSTGVITCIPNPELAVRNLLACLASDGFLLLWVYHPYGEHTRLLDRQLALFFAGLSADSSYAAKSEILAKLHLSLPPDQYGFTSPKQRMECSQASIDVDAYLHPVVNLFTFSEICTLLKRCGADWTAANGINWRGRSRLVDLGNTIQDRYFAVTALDLFTDEGCQQIFERLSIDQKLMVLELVMKPTGLTVLAGRGQSYTKLTNRVIQNVM
jgi:SAM-dependent methyltransferase